MTLDEMRTFVRDRTTPAPVPLVPEILLYQATELTPLWRATARELAGSDPAPFWAFAWAGGQALARHLLDHPALVRGRLAVDVACGSGLVAIAAARAGARHVIANDLDPFCEAVVALNAELNGVHVVFRRGDLTAGAAAPTRPDDLDDDDAEVILAGDVFYERLLAEALLARGARAAARGARALVGDPGRIYSPRTGLAELGVYEVPTSPEIESGPSLRTRVLEVLPG